jgi:hypothetical protein
MVLAMIKSKKDHEAIEWGRNEAPKFDLFFDYVFYGHFDHNYIRFSDITYSNCYEKDIITGEIPTEPTFKYWEVANI